MPVTSSHPELPAGEAAHRSQAEIDRQRGRFVPWIIGAFYVAFMSALIGFVFIAYAHPPADATEGAYDKGLAYNETLAKAAEQAGYGWRSSVAYTHGKIEFTLQGRADESLTHARVRAWFVHPDNPALDRVFDLAEDKAGKYWADAPLPAKGLWTVHVTAARLGNEYQTVTQLRIE